jgi:hypothetical protein
MDNKLYKYHPEDCYGFKVNILHVNPLLGYVYGTDLKLVHDNIWKSL